MIFMVGHEHGKNQPKHTPWFCGACCLPARSARPLLLKMCCVFLLSGLYNQAKVRAQSSPVQSQSSPDPGESNKQVALVPARVIHSVDPIYPPNAPSTLGESSVELIVTILANGSIGEIQVTRSGGKAFDDAAVEAMRLWR